MKKGRKIYKNWGNQGEILIILVLSNIFGKITEIRMKKLNKILP